MQQNILIQKKILQSYKNQKDIKTLENVFSILKKKNLKIVEFCTLVQVLSIKIEI